MFVIYNTPVGQYVIPPMIAMNSYCDQSGFWLYKTPAKWKLENPSVAETLILDGFQFDGKSLQGQPAVIFRLNQRFDWVNEYNPTNTRNVQGGTQYIIDTKTDEVMRKRIDFAAYAYPLYAPQTCFKKEDREKWGINKEGFTEYKWKFQFLGEKQ